jgi:hypothetical protein
VKNEEVIGINSIAELQSFKFLLESEVGIPFNTNVMRIALNFTEEKIAW